MLAALMQGDENSLLCKLGINNMRLRSATRPPCLPADPGEILPADCHLQKHSYCTAAGLLLVFYQVRGHSCMEPGLRLRSRCCLPFFGGICYNFMQLLLHVMRSLGGNLMDPGRHLNRAWVALVKKLVHTREEPGDICLEPLGHSQNLGGNGSIDELVKTHCEEL
jgi:hypothetical protein